MINFLFFLTLVFSQHQNLKEYNYVFKINQNVKTCDKVDSILPNGDKVQIPIFNNIVPVIYIQEQKNNHHTLSLDYDDKKCGVFKNEKLFSYQTEDKTSNLGPSFLETFFTIQKQISEMKLINKNSVSAVEEKLNNLSQQLKELKKMALDLQSAESQSMSFYKLENKKENDKNFGELKTLLSEVQKELVQIKQKLDSKQTKKDIIEPSLPIIDNAVTPNIK